jgi:DNA-binding Xre family transcriptional regulator
MLRLNLQPIFKARGIDKPYTFLVKAGFSAHSATVILGSNLKEIKLNYIEVLCENLNCEPNDLFLWIPDNEKMITDKHPLYNLRNRASDAENITLRDVPYKQLKELTSMLTAQQNDGKLQ